MDIENIEFINVEGEDEQLLQFLQSIGMADVFLILKGI